MARVVNRLGIGRLVLTLDAWSMCWEATGYPLFLSPWAGGFVADNAAWTAWIAGALATALGVGGYLRGERLEFTTSVRDDAARQYRARFGRTA